MSLPQTLQPSPDDENTLLIRRRPQPVPPPVEISASEAPTVPPLPGLPVELVDHPRYRIVAELGRGGMGVVYKAEHRLMERTVALKVISADLVSSNQAVERFRQE